MIVILDKVNAFYGQSHILFDIDLAIAEGEVVSLLGRNGAGKTTTLRTIMGLNPPRSGRITFRGDSIAGKRPFDICRRGIGFVPEDRRIFPELTVHENLEVGGLHSSGERAWTIERAYEFFPGLAARRSNKGNQLSGGEQQMLTIARALMGNPALILLDEPSEGLAPTIVKTVGDIIGAIKEEGISVLLVEQNATFACRLSDRVYIIDDGRMRFQGAVPELEANAELKATYLAV